MRFTSPASTPPGPISRKRTPSPASRAACCMHSIQRTGAVSWSTSKRRARAASHLRLVVDHAEFAEPHFPVLANATAEAVTTAARARRLLVDQLTAPVRWIECMQHAARLAGEGVRFLEIGPGGVLAGLVKRILP